MQTKENIIKEIIKLLGDETVKGEGWESPEAFAKYLMWWKKRQLTIFREFLRSYT